VEVPLQGAFVRCPAELGAQDSLDGEGSPDFKPAAWKRVLARLRRDIPSLTADEADRALQAVGADRPRTLNRLDRYLSAHETGLLTPLSGCPAVIVRLTVRLATDGYAEVVPLGCSRCGQQSDVKHLRTTSGIMSVA
jgi:hypothetical protein